MKEPQRDEDAAAEQRTAEQEIGQVPLSAIEPKAYVFDGWGMVPLEST